MERINIAQVDIDVQALITKSAEVREKLMAIGGEMKSLKSDFDKGNVSTEEYTRKLTLLTTEQKAQRDELRVYDTLVKNHIATEAEHMKSNTTLKGSIKELSAALSQNKLIYQQLSEEERNNAEVGGALLKTIQEQDKKYKELQKSIGNTQVDVGNYRQAILDAVGNNQAFGSSMNSVVNTFNSLKVNIVALSTPFVNFVKTGKLAPTALNATATATKGVSTGMKILRGAIISTGIGALIVALGSLISYFTSTQEGIDKVNRVLTPLKVLFQTFIGVAQRLGKSLVEAFKNPKQLLKDLLDFLKGQVINRVNGFINVFKGIGTILKGNVKEGLKQVGDAMLQTTTGVKDVVGKVKDMANGLKSTMNEAIERGRQIEKINQRLASTEAEFIRKSEELKLQFDEQNQIARDTSKTLAEREEAAKKSIELQRELNKLVTERKNLEIEVIELKQQSNDTSDAEKADLERQKAEINKAKSEQIRSEIAQTKVLNTIRRGANDEAVNQARARVQEELRVQKEAVEDYVKTNSAVAQSLKERLAIEEKGMNDRLAVLEQERAKGVVKNNEYEKQKRDIEEAFLKTRVDLSVDAVKREAEQYEVLNKSKIDSETRLTAELITAEQVRQEAIYLKKVEALEKEKILKQEARNWDYVAEDDYQQKLRELKEGYDEKSKELSKQQGDLEKEEKRAQQELDFQDRLLTLQEQGAMSWEIEDEQLRQNHEKERQALDELLATNQISKEQYNRRSVQLTRKKTIEETDLEKKKEEAKLALATGALSQAKQLFGEHTAIGKASAIAEATINTYLGITKALSAYPPPYNAIMAGVTGAMGMMNVKKIMTTEAKYEKGGLLIGKSHSEGGIPFTVAGRGGFEAEGGEYIVNKRATALYFPVLEAINRSIGGGRYNPVYMASGGVVKQVSDVKIDYKELTNAIKEGAMQGTQAGAYEGAMQGALQGSQQGAFEGARAGSLEGAMQGTYEGATLGTTSGLTDSILRISDNERVRQSASI